MKIDHRVKTAPPQQIVPAFQRESLPAISAKSDSELMAEIVSHSEAALATLLARHSPLLRAVIYRVLNNGAEVEDVLQDVFLHIWNHAESYSEHRGQFIGWATTIANRRSIDRVRKRSAYQRAMTRLEESTKHPAITQYSSWTVDKEVRNNELRGIVNAHLQLLPVHQSEVVKLSFLNGLSQREIAALLSVPLGTVKTRFELGVRKLTRSKLCELAA